MVNTASKIIEIAFEGKVDKAGMPYINHLWRVSEKARNYLWGNKELEVVAILHDLLEDCPEWTKDKLLEEFPNSVVKAVECLTHLDNESYEEYINRVLTNEMAIIVKQFDLEDNLDITRLKVLNEQDLKRLNKYLKAYHRVVGS